jgi:aspartate ammonia-lyase
MMTVLERVIAAGASAIGADPEDLRWLATGARLREWQPGEWLFHESTPYDWTGIIEDGDVDIIRGLHGDEHLLYTLGTGSMVSEGTILGNTAHFASARTRTGARLWVITRETMDHVRQQNPQSYHRIVARVGQRLADRVRLLSDTSLGASGSPAPLVLRRERDLLGEREVPGRAYFGVQTLRAVENFAISGVALREFPRFINAFAYVKKAAALANAELGVLSNEKRDAIAQACDEITAGYLHDQFVVDMIQGGAGTSTNMNVNEVIANRGLEILGHQRGQYEHLHPNDDVNCSQSTNDAYPTALKLGVFLASRDTLTAMAALHAALRMKGEQFTHVIKMGRTQLQDAVPMTLGQEFSAYATMINHARSHIDDAAQELLDISLGATAIGTGIASPPGYASLVTTRLAECSGLPVRLASDLIEATQNSSAFVEFSGALKRAAVVISKICNDLRLLSSGPRAGLNEINLPPTQPGSSIMPGKVNPVIPEVVNQVCFQLIGYDATISIAAEASQLELNMAEPIIAYDLLHGLLILKNACITLESRCVSGITANEDVCRGYVERSIGVVTALVPRIGYERGVAIAREALASGRSVCELVRERGWLDDEELAGLLAPEAMTDPRRPSEWAVTPIGVPAPQHVTQTAPLEAVAD